MLDLFIVQTAIILSSLTPDKHAPNKTSSTHFKHEKDTLVRLLQRGCATHWSYFIIFRLQMDSSYITGWSNTGRRAATPRLVSSYTCIHHNTDASKWGLLVSCYISNNLLESPRGCLVPWPSPNQAQASLLGPVSLPASVLGPVQAWTAIPPGPGPGRTRESVVWGEPGPSQLRPRSAWWAHLAWTGHCIKDEPHRPARVYPGYCSPEPPLCCSLLSPSGSRPSSSSSQFFRRRRCTPPASLVRPQGLWVHSSIPSSPISAWFLSCRYATLLDLLDSSVYVILCSICMLSFWEFVNDVCVRSMP